MLEKMKVILNRVKDIILKPRMTWEVIRGEETTVPNLFTKYFLYLAAVPVIASFLGRMIVGYDMPFVEPIRLSFGQSLVISLIEYILFVAGIYVLGKIIVFLAPKFGSNSDESNGFKVAVYSCTPYFAAGVLLLIPSLGILVSLAGLFGLYLLYIGLPIVLDTPKERSLAFVIVIIVAMIMLGIVVGSITQVMVRIFGPSVYVG